MNGLMRVAIGGMLAGLVGCAAGSSSETGAPIVLQVPKAELPGPGLCRVWVSGLELSRQQRSRSCDGIEYSAPLGSRVLYRPDDGSREVHVRYMSTGTPGLVVGIDAFSIDTLRLRRVIMPYTGGA